MELSEIIRIDANGRFTLSRDIRRNLDLDEGDGVAITVPHVSKGADSVTPSDDAPMISTTKTIQSRGRIQFDETERTLLNLDDLEDDALNLTLQVESLD